MFGCKCFYWNREYEVVSPEPEPFCLPDPIPPWPQGGSFAKGRICIGELEVIQVTKFEHVWSCSRLKGKTVGASFYRPVGIPDGYHSLGHYCQLSRKPLHGFILAAKEKNKAVDNPALEKPVDYTLIWSTDDYTEDFPGGCGYFWLPNPPDGYKAMGCLVTNDRRKPELDEVRCVRADLTDTCETYDLILSTDSVLPKFPFRVWSTRPCDRGMWGKGLSLGTFCCSNFWSSEEESGIACLKNLDPTLQTMPTLNQIHALIKHYGPTVFFHPDEIYLPSSVSWFFKNGALLYQKHVIEGEAIDSKGSNLPMGGENDGEYWIDLPFYDPDDLVKRGNIESSELYVHVKPAFGGTFTDIAMWVFCPFNGPATLKVGMANFPFSKIGEHVGDWEHYTLRISNFNGELCGIYFSQHSGGEWVDACDLEYFNGNKAVVYSSKSGHASFPQPGIYLQGSHKLGIGIRNDCARSDFYVDSSMKYQIVAAEYLGEGKVAEPCWLQYMREWGPTIVYNSRSELDKLISRLPVLVRFSVENLFDKFPVELYGEEGPTGPKEKNNWAGDERC